MRRPRAICFDMGYTLMRHTPTGAELYRQVLARAGHEFDASTVEAALVPARELYVRATREGRDFESSMVLATEFWAEYTLLVLAGLGLAPETRVALADLINTEAWSPTCWEVFEDSLPALDALRDMGLKLAIVSNFVDTLPGLCARGGFAEHFDVVVASVEAGAMKPDRRIWDHTLRRLGVAPDQTWHVGDNYWTDVMGARAAGLTPVLLDRAGEVPKPDCLSVGGLLELVELVEGLEEAEAAA